MRPLYSFPALLPVLLVTLLALAAPAQPVPRPEADSLLRLLRAGKPDTNRVNQLIRLGEYQVYKPGEFAADMDSARDYARQAQGLSRRLGHYPGEARSLDLLGTISRESKEWEQSLTYHQAALRLYRGQGDWQGEAAGYLLLARARRDKGDAPGARREVQKAITLYRGKGYHRGVAQAHLEMGNSYGDWGEELKEKIGYYQQALQGFAKANDKKKQADVHKDLGDLYTVQGSVALALLELRKALALYRAIHHPHLQGVYDLLGAVSTEMGDYQDGLRYGLLAVKTAERLKDSTMQLCTVYNRLGITYFHLKQYPKAHLYYDKAMRIAQKYNDRPSILIMAGNIAAVLYKLGQTEASLRLLLSTAKQYPPQNSSDSLFLASRLLFRYTNLKQYALAQQYCNQLLSFAYRLGKNSYERNLIYNSIIPFFIASKQHRQARKHLAAYEEFCANTQYLKGLSDTQLYWFQVDSMQANYLSAMRHYQQYKRLEDSLFNETKSRQLASLDVLYETEKKEQDIELKAQRIKALTRERQLQATQIEQDQLVRNAL
ncbi:MAG: tetratricopeptide repeat protein, partial [Cytophagales bacterium]|nr:tetratricopeptide repeat protein [Cytophagales bacterium]